MEDLGRSIELPPATDEAFRKLRQAKVVALDVGGSLTKIAYYSTVNFRKLVYDSRGVPQGAATNIEVRDDGVYELRESARLHFVKFETKHIDVCLDYIRQSLVDCSSQQFAGQSIKVTGGGAYKYRDLIERKVGMPVDKCDEMKCIVKGCNFLLTNISDEAFVYERKGNPEYKFLTIDPRTLYPYLLVTIGSGVSVIKVESDSVFQRIGGTATGGGTFMGLGKLLTKAKRFDELLEMASKGDHRKVDMLVKDIYGESDDYHSLGLPPDIIASTLGKAMYAEEGEERSFTDADIARSLLFMISNDVGQISSLYAMLHNVKTIYFGGFFLRHHPVTMHTLGYSVNYWTKGQVQARFLRHEGYLGAIGAFLKGAQDCHIEENSWNENTYGSSGFVFRHRKTPTSSDHLEVDHLEMDRFETPLRFCPLLLDPTGYVADTVDLMRDSDAREYWIKCFEDSLPKFTERAIESQDHLGEEAKERAAKFSEQYLSRLRQLAVAPWQHGNLSVRLLLDMREHCLEEFDFHDPYLKQKQSENDEAFALLPKLLDRLDALEWEEREIELAYGMLAGNVFDWGAKEVALIMEKEGLNFDHAKRLIGPRPWLMDSLDAWVERIRAGPAHRCAAIFIDNSGADVVLGILPFVVAMLRRGTQVLLCANNKPVLNDVTYAELSTVIMQRAAAVSDVIDAALKTKQLECLDSGQSSPCLDLAKLSKSVVDAMLEKGVDLIVLEGMGRAVHTNLYTKFQCECLKAAVLKNRWLANRLGGDMYAVIFHYEDKPSQ